MPKDNLIPVYSLQSFSAPENLSQQFQIELFDANRHFKVEYPHRHDFYEVLYISNGSGFHVIDSNKYKIEPPCVFFMSPGQAHKLELSNDIEGFIYIFTAEFYLMNRTNQNHLIEYPFFFTLQQNNPPLLLSSQNDNLFIRSLFERAVSSAKDQKNCSIDLLRALLDLILTSCSTLYKIEGNLVNKGKGHILIKRFYQIVEEFYQQNLPVNEYASKLAVTANHLTQTLKQLTGKTTIEIIKSKQILEIKRLLVHTNMSISEIALKLNFADQSYFSKFFKRETTMTPYEFRSKYTN